MLEVWDANVVSDDLLATVYGDLRPVNPSGQTFTVANSAASLRVKVEGEGVDATSPAERKTAPLPAP